MEIEQKEFDDSLIKVFNSCISKCEKVVAKLDSESWQAKWTERQLDAYRLSLDMLLNQPNVDYSNERLINVEKTLQELLAKCEEMLAKLKEGSPQHTLALRRHRAFLSVIELIKSKLEDKYNEIF